MNIFAKKLFVLSQMKEIVECVANISEGQNQTVIDQIGEAIESEAHTTLLHVDSGYDANRTVFTFVGNLESLERSVHNMFRTALKHIDLSTHHGKHPRIGVVDVCPFVAIQGVTMKELLSWTTKIASSLATEFSLPIYLYEKSASRPYRQSLEAIRKGGYENLATKLIDPQWKPDYGPITGWEKSGATVLGVRHFLLAYNINLQSTDVTIAKRIAKKIRGSGYTENGRRVPGIFPSVKAIGWYISDFGFTQVSTNLTDYSTCSLHHVYTMCEKLATDYGVKVNGSELIGLCPKEPLIHAGKHYEPQITDEADLIHIAVEKLGLSSIQPFIPNERIIEFLI